MIVHLPTLKQLQYLVALRTHGHFGKAAEACFVTQSTLSAGIRELETLLGTILVERTRRVVRFTPLGLRIAEKAVRVLREGEELTDMARAEGQPLTGELRMGVIPTIAPFLLPAMLPRLRQQFPRLKLFLREETSQAACDALHRGQLDCVLLAMPYACGDVDHANLFDDRLLIAYPQGEAPEGVSVEARAIDEQRLLLLEDGHCLKDHALAACNRPELRAEAAMMGIPTPAMSSALAFYDGYRRDRLPANLLQAQRDYFGAHTYERVDKPRGEFFHTNWTGRGGKVSSRSYNA